MSDLELCPVTEHVLEAINPRVYRLVTSVGKFQENGGTGILFDPHNQDVQLFHP